MIPTTEYEADTEEIEADFEVDEQPSLTYAMKIAEKEDEDNIFVGRADEEEALQQAILKILQTERYEYPIYSHDYGIELQDLIGAPVHYAMSELKERITEALTQDDRIESVGDFEVEQVEKDAIHCTFLVIGTNGENVNGDLEVTI